MHIPEVYPKPEEVAETKSIGGHAQADQLVMSAAQTALRLAVSCDARLTLEAFWHLRKYFWALHGKRQKQVGIAQRVRGEGAK